MSTTVAPPVEAARRYATLTFTRGALTALAVTLAAGVCGVFFYLPGTAAWLMGHGVEFTALRPIHTTFASVWIFLGGVAVVHRYLEDHAPAPDNAERWRLRIQVLLWAFAGLGILISLAAGVTSGREYMGFHPALSIPILLGWLLFAWNFFRATWRDFFGRPVYVTMWGVGVLLFIYTFLEEHAWLLPDVFASPIVDLRVQWKATGTLVGAFNLFVYGALYYVAEKLSGDERYAHSNLAYALLGVGLLNSFTNFGHHTYHIPQSELVKWISFLVSMTEIVILARVAWDIAGLASRRVTGSFDAASFFIVSAKWWICAMLFTAILISVPPLNSLIHGTHVVTAHAMGTQIGIDGMILFAAIAWLFAERASGAPPGLRWPAVGLNLSAAGLVTWLSFSGAVVGYTRYQHLPQPTWLRDASPIVFVVAGLATAGFMGVILAAWLGLAFGPGRPR